MKCPQCKTNIKKVRIYEEHYRYGTLEKNKIIDTGRIVDITETTAIECDNCHYDFYETGELIY